MSPIEAVLIFFGGMFAGAINSMAGGGSLLTVPLLSLAGVEGLFANGTNRVAVLIQNASSGYGYASKKVIGAREAAPIFLPAVVGGLIGALLVSGVDDALFEKIFGVMMFPMLALSDLEAEGEGGAKPGRSG
ncbi:MAG: sulfite exporter TauE/SafE family protein [Acidimicrobiales bacterium]